MKVKVGDPAEEGRRYTPPFWKDIGPLDGRLSMKFGERRWSGCESRLVSAKGWGVVCREICAAKPGAGE